MELGHNNALGAGTLTVSSGFSATSNAVNRASLIATVADIDIANAVATSSVLNVGTTAGGTVGQNFTLSGAISGSGGIQKQGANQLILSGTANSYLGVTNVLAGTLLVNNTHTGGDNYTVASGATLGGTGIIDLATLKTVAVSGSLAPGASIGVLTIGDVASPNDVSFLDNSKFLIELGDSGSSDLLNTFGAMSISGTGTELSFTQLPGTMLSGDYTIAQTTGGLISGMFASVSYNGGSVPTSHMVVYSSNMIQLLAVPEPGTLSLLGLAGVCLFSRRRRAS